MQIGKDEAIFFDDFTLRNPNRARKHRRIPNERMEFAILSARVNLAGQLTRQRRVELAPNERPIQPVGIHTGELRPDPACDHLFG